MRFTSTLVAGIFAVAANAQSSAASGTAATPTYSQTPEQSLQAAVLECVEACDPSDVSCQAGCITVPNPDETAANKTTECVAQCPQGDGSPEETQRYSDCSQKCISDFFLTTTFTGGPTPTSQAGSGSSSNAPSATPSPITVTSGSSTFVSTVTPSATSSDGDSASATESSSESSATGDSGAMRFAPVGSAGLLGLVAAFFAL